LKTYIECDIRQLILISNEHRFLTFAKTATACIGQLLNYNNMVKNVGEK